MVEPLNYVPSFSGIYIVISGSKPLHSGHSLKVSSSLAAVGKIADIWWAFYIYNDKICAYKCRESWETKERQKEKEAKTKQRSSSKNSDKQVSASTLMWF